MIALRSRPRRQSIQARVPWPTVVGGQRAQLVARLFQAVDEQELADARALRLRDVGARGPLRQRRGARFRGPGGQPGQGLARAEAVVAVLEPPHGLVVEGAGALHLAEGGARAARPVQEPGGGAGLLAAAGHSFEQRRRFLVAARAVVEEADPPGRALGVLAAGPVHQQPAVVGHRLRVARVLLLVVGELDQRLFAPGRPREALDHRLVGGQAAAPRALAGQEVGRLRRLRRAAADGVQGGFGVTGAAQGEERPAQAHAREVERIARGPALEGRPEGGGRGGVLPGLEQRVSPPDRPVAKRLGRLGRQQRAREHAGGRRRPAPGGWPGSRGPAGRRPRRPPWPRPEPPGPGPAAAGPGAPGQGTGPVPARARPPPWPSRPPPRTRRPPAATPYKRAAASGRDRPRPGTRPPPSAGSRASSARPRARVAWASRAVFLMSGWER